MLPHVTGLTHVEMIRDGGSFAATFDSDGSRYILFIPICIVDHEPPMKERAAYGEPILIDANPAKRPADTATAIYSELCGPHVALSWDQAGDILTAAANHAARLRPINAEWLKQMIRVVAGKGQVKSQPPD